MNESATKESYFWAEQIRAVAILAVLTIHVSGGLVLEYGKIRYDHWMTAHVYDSIVRFSVPLFLMISGALLFPKEYGIRDFMRKRFKKILWPFLFWGLIYTLYNLIQKLNNGYQMSVKNIVMFIFRNFRDKPYDHFWFLYLLIGLYLFYPILSSWARRATENQLLYFLIIWFAISLTTIGYLHNLVPKIELRYFSGFIGYPVLGFYLSRIRWRNPVKIGLACFILGTLMTFCATLVEIRKSGNFSEIFYNTTTPNVIIASMGIFLVLRYCEVHQRFIRRLLVEISTQSFGIYFVHILILIMLSSLGMAGDFVHPAIGIPVIVLICMAVSYAIIKVLKLVPLLGRIVG
ncbi:MAG: hypothetical protein EOO50_16020 [Flavobacterium sp.]|uniref:acyltransferase n=1 Tax=Flavobacterium sp. TaxID=239 RepID=UPI0012206A37|nr:acyltransferase family protein [Flavobacterium sp.]RZJ64306.1 MAG: hypothetical protein EOO50_16020 [Flavobacterium sp.]